MEVTLVYADPQHRPVQVRRVENTHFLYLLLCRPSLSLRF